jgi:capsular polysaccharide transport system permease protein
VSILLPYTRNTAAMLLRELNSRYGNKPGGYLWAFVDPVAYIMLLTFFREALNRSPPIGDSVAVFIASGYIGYFCFQSVAGYIAQAVKGNKKLLLYPAIAPIDAVTARFILQILTITGVAVCIFFVASFDAQRIPRFHVGVMLEAGMMAAFFGLGIGMMNISLFAKFPIYEKAFGMVMRPMFMLSGVFILPDELPPPFQTYLMYNPVVHYVMWFRSGVYGDYRAGLLDYGYAIDAAALAVIAGLALFTAGARSIREPN